MIFTLFFPFPIAHSLMYNLFLSYLHNLSFSGRSRSWSHQKKFVILGKSSSELRGEKQVEQHHNRACQMLDITSSSHSIS